MNKIKSTPLFLFCVIALFSSTSCFQDRSKEFEAEIGVTKWIYEVMDNRYLWYEDMPAETSLNYFQDPATFFTSLLSSKDGKSSYKYSAIESSATTGRSASHLSYGYQYMVYLDSSSGQVYIRILYVLPGSPAEKAGLKRGWFISEVNGTELTESNYYDLINSGQEAEYMVFYNVNEEGEPVDHQTLSITSAVLIQESPFYLDTIYSINSKKVGYLVYNSFDMGTDDTGEDTTYLTEMELLFNRIKQQQPDEFILDLRYNPGGYLYAAQWLASMLVPDERAGERFVYLTFNDKTSGNEIYNFINTTANLTLPRLYVIVTGATASASEAVIHGLNPYMEVNLIGQRTEGKNVGSTRFDSDEYPWILYPIICYIYNSENSTNYADGFLPEVIINESSYYPWYDLGDTRELLLNYALGKIFPEEEATAVSYYTRTITHRFTPTEKSSIGDKRIRGNMIH